jgi:hypothetical protein
MESPTINSISEFITWIRGVQLNEFYSPFDVFAHEHEYIGIRLLESYSVSVDHDTTINFDKAGNCTDEEHSIRKHQPGSDYWKAWDFAQLWISYDQMERRLIDDLRDSEPFFVYKNYPDFWSQNVYNVYESIRALRHSIDSTYPKFGYVYIIAEPSGTFKIGKTSNLEQRIKTHGVKLPYKDVKYLHTFPCLDMSKTEAALHDMYKWQRLNGEWFLLNQSQLDAIRGLSYCDDTDEMLELLPLCTEELRSCARELNNG